MVRAHESGADYSRDSAALLRTFRTRFLLLNALPVPMLRQALFRGYAENIVNNDVFVTSEKNKGFRTHENVVNNGVFEKRPFKNIVNKGVFATWSRSFFEKSPGVVLDLFFDRFWRVRESRWGVLETPLALFGSTWSHFEWSPRAPWGTRGDILSIYGSLRGIFVVGTCISYRNEATLMPKTRISYRNLCMFP